MIRPRALRTTLVAALLLPALSTGCLYLGSARSFRPERLEEEPGWVAARGVPLVRQRAAEDCGAAALAMVLSYWGSPTTREDVLRDCPVEPRRGIQAGSLRDCARDRGLSAFLFVGQFRDLESELSRQRPVLVGLVKPHLFGARTHYEVVVAVHPGRKALVTLDPARGWRVNDAEGFLEEWQPAARLSLVVFPQALALSPSVGPTPAMESSHDP